MHLIIHRNSFTCFEVFHNEVHQPSGACTNAVSTNMIYQLYFTLLSVFFFYFNTLHFIKSTFISQKFDNSNSGADINVDMIDNSFLIVQQFLYQACFYNKKVPIGFS